MATEDYVVRYVADPTSFIAGARQVSALVTEIDHKVTAAKQNSGGMYGGMGRSASAAAKNLDALSAALGQTTQATATASSAAANFTTAGARAAKSTDALAGSTGGLVTQVTAIAVAWNVATAAVMAYSKAAADAKKHEIGGANKGLDMREKAREYAGLMEHNTPDDEVLKRLLDDGQKSGTKFADILKFGEAFLGTIPAGRTAGHITPEQEKRLEQEGKVFAKRTGMDLGTAGDLVASIPQFMDLTKDENGKPLTTEQGVDKAMGQLRAMHFGMSEGRGSISTLTRNELGQFAPALASGHVRDHAELTGFIGTASTIGKGASGAGTVFARMDRLVNEGLGAGGEFLKSIGVADAKGDEAKLDALAAHIEAQRKAAPDPSKFDTTKYLQSRGFHNDEEVKSTVGYLASLPVLKANLKKGRVKAAEGKQALKDNQEFLNSPIGQRDQGVAIQEAGEFYQTLHRQRLESAREAARGQLQANDEIDTKGTNFVDNLFDYSPAGWFSSEYSKDSRVNAQVWKNFRTQVKAAGMEDEVLQADPRLLDLTPEQIKARKAANPALKDVPIYRQKPYGGQNAPQLGDALNRFGPALEKKGYPINGYTVAAPGGQVPAQAPAAIPAQGDAAGGANVPVKVAGLDPATLGGSGGQVVAAAQRPIVATRTETGAVAPGVWGAPGGGGSGEEFRDLKEVVMGLKEAVAGLKEAVPVLKQSGQMLASAGRQFNNNRPAPGADHGGDYGPYRA